MTLAVQPEALDYGIEIECLIPTMQQGHYRALGSQLGPGLARAINDAGVPCDYAGYTHVARSAWKIVTDGSLRPPPGYTGLEFVSPILTEGTEGFTQIETVCRVLREAGAKINRSCGFHVHVGARHLSVSGMRKLAILFVENEEVFDSLLPPSRRGNRNRQYCQSVKDSLNLGALLAGTTIREVQEATAQGKYYKLNISAFWNYGTVEFRHHSGTVDALKIHKWVLLCLGMVRTAGAQAHEPIPGVRAGDHPYWRKGKRTRTLYELLKRPEGVTSEEARVALGVRSRPNIRWHLEKAGAPQTNRGRRRRMEVFRLSDDTISAPLARSTLETLLTKLGVPDEDRQFWRERAEYWRTREEPRGREAEVL